MQLFVDGHGEVITDERLAGGNKRLERAIDTLGNSALEWKRKALRYEADLHECLEFLEGYEDVIDGSYGEPAPNRAMSLANMIRETLGIA